MGDFSNDPSRPIEINEMSGNPFMGLFKYLNRSVSSVASGHGLIQDAKYGGSYKASPSQEAVSASAENEETPAYHYEEKRMSLKEFALQAPPEEDTLKEESHETEDEPREKETFETEATEIIQKPRKMPISLLINESPSFPPRTYKDEKILMDVRLAPGDRVAFLKDEEKRIYDEIYHDGGVYSFAIEREDVQVRKVTSDASESEEVEKDDLNEEFTRVIKSDLDWDKI